MYDLLNGIRVIEGSAFVAAPLGGMTLAQLGADVIRFDPIGGGLDYGRWPINEEGKSLYWAGLNKGKRSISIDLKSEAGQELATALITAPGTGAGIFLTNFPEAGWLAYDRLKERRPDLIMVNIQGNADGSSAVDYTINCAAGIPYATGPAGSDNPVNHMLPAWDLLTGTNAALAVLASELSRREDGEGQLIKLALSDVAFATIGNLGHIAEVQIKGENRPPIGNRLYGAFGYDFATLDGERVMIVAITRRQWSNLVAATGLNTELDVLAQRTGLDLLDEGQRYQATDAITQLLVPWCAARPLAAIAEAFNKAGVCWGPYQTFSQLVERDPRISNNPVFEQVEQPGIGSYYMPGSPLRFSALDRKPVQPAPTLGGDTDEVLSDILGLTSYEIGALHDRGVIAGPDKHKKNRSQAG
ncbi:MAG: CoA transferase [Gammaproteobacteria bacterium]